MLLLRPFLLAVILLKVYSLRRRPSSASTNIESNEKTYSIDEYLVKPLQTNSSTILNHLISQSLSFEDLLRFHHYYSLNIYIQESTGDKWDNEVLAYVTPWNRKGYEFSVLMRNKLRWVSPVWFQIRKDRNNYVVAGLHDINHSWLHDIRAESGMCIGLENSETCSANVPKPLLFIVPRVMFEANIEMSDVSKIANELINLAAKYLFDGFTLETGGQYQNGIILAKHLKENGLKVIFVIPPILIDTKSTIEWIKAISDYSDRISIMTYDHSNRQLSGDVNGMYNAPYNWVESIVSSFVQSKTKAHEKLLLGIPMYGWKGVEAMTGETLLIWLAKNKASLKIQWSSEHKEHLFIKQTLPKETSSYPTPLFIKYRVELAKKYNISGVALWEVGQMLATFINVL